MRGMTRKSASIASGRAAKTIWLSLLLHWSTAPVMPQWLGSWSGMAGSKQRNATRLPTAMSAMTIQAARSPAENVRFMVSSPCP